MGFFNLISQLRVTPTNLNYKFKLKQIGLIEKVKDTLVVAAVVEGHQHVGP